MLILIAALVLGVILFRNSPRLEAPAETADMAVRAYVDGKPVKSYVKEYGNGNEQYRNLSVLREGNAKRDSVR